MSERKLAFDTLQVHAGQVPDPTTGARAVPIYQTTSFVYKNFEHAVALSTVAEFGFTYTRIVNPTADVLEQRIAALEGGTGALALASGSAATSYAILNLASGGDHIVSAQTLYGGTYNLFANTLPRYGITTTLVDPDDPENFRKAIQLNPNYAEALDNLGIALAAKGRFDEAIENFRQAIRINSNRPETFFHLGMTLGQLGRTHEAVAQYREALRLNPNLAGALNNLAWLLATSSDAGLRNGAEAVRLAERACGLTHYGQPLFIGTLAAAYAEAGRFPEAVTTAEKAEQLATTAGSKKLAEKTRQLLEFYRAGKPYHEPAPTGH